MMVAGITPTATTMLMMNGTAQSAVFAAFPGGMEWLSKGLEIMAWTVGPLVWLSALIYALCTLRRHRGISIAVAVCMTLLLAGFGWNAWLYLNHSPQEYARAHSGNDGGLDAILRWGRLFVSQVSFVALAFAAACGRRKGAPPSEP